MSQQSILKVQPSGTFSNKGYINPDTITEVLGSLYNESGK